MSTGIDVRPTGWTVAVTGNHGTHGFQADTVEAVDAICVTYDWEYAAIPATLNSEVRRGEAAARTAKFVLTAIKCGATHVREITP